MRIKLTDVLLGMTIWAVGLAVGAVVIPLLAQHRLSAEVIAVASGIFGIVWTGVVIGMLIDQAGP